MVKKARMSKAQRQAAMAETMVQNGQLEVPQGEAPVQTSEHAHVGEVAEPHAPAHTVDEQQEAEFAQSEADPVDAELAGEEARGAEEAELSEAAAVAEVEADNEKPNSVVAPKYKDKYLENAKALGIPGKAAKRSNWDWLSQQIAANTLDDKHKLKVPEFLHLLEANGVDHSKWTNRNKGWEGRLRMTGRVMLQKKVANSGQLVLTDGNMLAAPADFIEKYKDKA